MRLIICFFILFLISCSDTDDDIACKPVIFDKEMFDSQDNFGLQLLDYKLEGNCLKVNLGFSGCSDDHKIELVTDGITPATDPFNVITCDFYDHNPEMCEAYFTVEKEFDIQPIRDRYDGQPEIILRNNGTIIIL